MKIIFFVFLIPVGIFCFLLYKYLTMKPDDPKPKPDDPKPDDPKPDPAKPTSEARWRTSNEKLYLPIYDALILCGKTPPE